jgi:hypothetical protein
MNNTSSTVLFLKIMMRIHLDKDYNSLNRWQANRDLLSAFAFCSLLSVMMHLRQSKKVSILPSGDVNLGPVPSRQGLFEDNPYRAVWAAVRRAMSHDRAHRACGDIGMSCGHFRKT